MRHWLADMESEHEGKKEIKEFVHSPITFVVVNAIISSNISQLRAHTLVFVMSV